MVGRWGGCPKNYMDDGIVIYLSILINQYIYHMGREGGRRAQQAGWAAGGREWSGGKAGTPNTIQTMKSYSTRRYVPIGIYIMGGMEREGRRWQERAAGGAGRSG